tara:strand:- start:229 stop:357 length:129 start_codon:yes stop_codon:yes gene_type:complete
MTNFDNPLSYPKVFFITIRMSKIYIPIRPSRQAQEPDEEEED